MLQLTKLPICQATVKDYKTHPGLIKSVTRWLKKKQHKTKLQTYSGKTARRENSVYGIAPSEKTEKP